MTFAAKTKVDPAKSRTEIERTLEKYGATAFLTGYSEREGYVQFQAKGRIVKFILPLPDRTKAGAEQELRRRWRALLLVIKAKLEAVQTGIVTFDSEFLAHIVLPDGQTVGRWIEGPLKLAYDKGAMPPMLPDYSGRKP